MKKLIATLLTCVTICAMITTPASPTFVSEQDDSFAIIQTISAKAATTRKCYTISSSNTTVYSDTNLSKKLGTIFPTDELTVLDVTSKYSKVTYPISGKKTKTGFVPTSAILTATTGKTYQSTGKFTTYRRASTGNTYGSVAKGDSVIVLGSKNGMTQLKYPVAGGFKYAFAATADVQKYLNSSQPPVSSKMAWPIDGARCTWRTPGNQWSWGSYTSNSSGRNYHLGCDISGSNNTVKSFAAGTVAKVGYNKANGNFVIIRHNVSGKTVYSFYAHLASYCVSNGTKVNQGTKIGIMGNTGSASKGAHLHFAIVDTVWTSGGYYGYATKFSGNKVSYGGVTYYSPYYVVNYQKLP